MAGFGNFLQGAIDYKLKDDERKKEMAMYQKKLELANKLAMDLEERKRQLAQKYPTYTKYVTTSEGDVIGLDTMGNQKQVYTADPELRKAKRAQMAAYAARAQATADRTPAQIEADLARAALANANASRVPSQIGLDNARANLLKERTENPGKFTKGGRLPNELTPNAKLDGFNRFRILNGTIDPVTGKVTPLPDSEETNKAYEEYLRRLNLQSPLYPNPQSQDAESPFDPEDFPNLFMMDN